MQQATTTLPTPRATVESEALERPAFPPPPPSDRAEPDPERVRQEALLELGRLIRQLERWRRTQMEQRNGSVARWVLVRDPSGASVRIRFERGQPVQLRTAASDRVQALAAAGAALDLDLRIGGRWERDANTLDWVVAIAAPARA